MFLSRRKDEDRVCRRLLQSLEECIEGCLREHMYLVDDIYAVFTDLRRHAHLVHQSLYVLDTIIGSSIEFMDTIRTSFCKRET